MIISVPDHIWGRGKDTHIYLNKFPTLQVLILNISAVTSVIKRFCFICKCLML